MTKALPFTKASMRRAIAAAQAAGLEVTGITSDGTILTANASLVPKPDETGQTDAYAIAAERANAKAKRKRNRAAS